MKLEERKRLEDKISQILGDLTKGEKALLYKTLYTQGIKLAAWFCQEPPQLVSERGCR